MKTVGMGFFEKVWQQLKTTGSAGGYNPYAAYNATRTVPAGTAPCLAPWTSLSFNIDGYATICCLNRKATVAIENNSIDAIWNSEPFKLLRQNVAQQNLEHDCGICSAQINAGNFAGVKAVGYDTYYPYNAERPQLMEFCLDNTCNLACTMCNSLLSSSIRTNEKLPPLKKQYDDSFVEQLDAYIPFLKEAVFSGGEPFLIPAYFKIWERMLALNPNLTIGVVTNGSVLNQRVKDLLERGRFKINISIDSVDKRTYEAIRCNADFDTLMQNFEWFKAYGIRKNLPINIPVCPLRANWDKIPGVVRFANKHNVSLNFVYIDRPIAMTLTYSEPAYLQKVAEQLRIETFVADTPVAKNNVKRFNGLIDDIKKWQQINSAAIEKLPAAEALQLLESRIQESNEIEQPVGAGDVKAEMVLKVKTLLSELPPTNHESILAVFNSYSAARLQHFLQGKTTHEIAVFFKEYLG